MGASNELIKKAAKILFGILLMLFGVMTYVVWWSKELLILIKGGLGIFLFLIGLMFLFIGLSE